MDLRNLFSWLDSLSCPRYRATKCAHRTKLCGRVSAFGRTVTSTMSRNQDGSIAYCLNCLGKMAIQCAWCKAPIFVGDPITLHTPIKTFQTPEYAVVYSEEPRRLVGCLGWNCSDSGMDRAGFWVAGEDSKGRVRRVETPLERLLGTREPSTIVGNLHDIEEATRT